MNDNRHAHHDPAASELDCASVHEALHAFIDGEFELIGSQLGARAVEHLDAHVSACRPCSEEMRAIQDIQRRLACACGCEAPPELHARIITRITQMYAEGETIVHSEQIHIQEF